MGYLDLGPLDNSTVQFHNYGPIQTDVSFFGGQALPPGNYTILTSGQYNNILPLSLYPDWYNYAGTLQADNDYRTASNTGMEINYHGPAGIPNNVSNLRISPGKLQINNTGGSLQCSMMRPDPIMPVRLQGM